MTEGGRGRECSRSRILIDVGVAEGSIGCLWSLRRADFDLRNDNVVGGVGKEDTRNRFVYRNSRYGGGRWGGRGQSVETVVVSSR